MDRDDTDVVARINDLISVLQDDPKETVDGKKGILIVESCHVHVMNWNRPVDSTGPRAECTVELNGVPSPSSELRPVRAYVKVIRDDLTIRRPTFNQKGWINMEIHRRDQEALLAIVDQPTWYCWYWELENGSVYAGVHSNP